MTTMNSPENSAVIETPRFMACALTYSVPPRLMSLRISGATVPTVPANSQKVITPRTMPNSSLSVPR